MLCFSFLFFSRFFFLSRFVISRALEISSEPAGSFVWITTIHSGGHRAIHCLAPGLGPGPTKPPATKDDRFVLLCTAIAPALSQQQTQNPTEFLIRLGTESEIKETSISAWVTQTLPGGTLSPVAETDSSILPWMQQHTALRVRLIVRDQLQKASRRFFFPLPPNPSKKESRKRILNIVSLKGLW